MDQDNPLELRPRLRMLSDEQLAAIHSAALYILLRVGVTVHEPQALAVLEKIGAEIDGDRVRIQPHLVERAISLAPSRVVLCDSRSGSPRLFLEGSNAYFGTGSDTIAVIDYQTGERRPPLKSDIGKAALLCDALPNIDFVMSMGIASDVPQAISDLHHFEAMVANTSKPLLVTAWGQEHMEDIVAMAEAVAGGEATLRANPFIVMYSEPISPLQLALEPTQKVVYMARKGLPVICGTGKVGGATCPVTLAGALAQGTAESLAAIVIAQHVREGAPVIFGGERLHMDMKTTMASYGAPEFMMSVAANAELANYYRLPSWSYAGCSDAKLFDQQAAAEGALMSLLAGLSGGNLNHDVGYLEAGLTASFEAVAFFDEVIGMVRRIMQGIPVTPETLALDVISQVGPGGEFLTHEHTFKHFKADWFPGLMDRQSHSGWTQAGSSSMSDRTHQRVGQLLRTHQPPALAESTIARMAAIIRHAEARIGSFAGQVAPEHPGGGK